MCFRGVYVDADVRITGASLSALVEALSSPGTQVAGPDRKLMFERASWVVRAYYTVWHGFRKCDLVFSGVA